MKEQHKQNSQDCAAPAAAVPRRAYSKPELNQVGTLADLTQGFAGSVPDEQGGMTKRNPFQG